MIKRRKLAQAAARKPPLSARRAQRRTAFHHSRIASASTLLERWSAVCDWYLAAVRHAPAADAADELRHTIALVEDRAAALEAKSQ